ncbi:LysE family translocator [Jannaschia sp. M317]|uniref:LysE family translocator n=1 Tax=Jannaschia sp. M317 TaxID=2867011 RepID=UPI0021A418BC|nr:LysE family translocator [Jannaschia sp. M317]UWQ17404.1 LysE family translocator [Jannaschia sp. M317]
MLSIQFLLTALVVVLTPGTGAIYTLAMGLGRGRAAALAAATGCTLSILPALAAAGLGLAALLHASAVLFTAVKLAGVAYLLWMAWGALRQTGALAVRPADRVAEPLWRVAWRGVLINALNPKLSIFFLALLPPFLSGNPDTASLELAAMGATFMVMTFATFAAYGLFASHFRDWLMSSTRVMAWLNRSFAMIFAALAGRLVLEKA